MTENPGRGQKISRMGSFLGLNRCMGAMLAMVVLVGLGEKMAERFLPLYLLALGAGTQSVGFLNAMDNLLGALYSFPGGVLSDRWGAKKALMAFTALAMAGYVVVILVPACGPSSRGRCCSSAGRPSPSPGSWDWSARPSRRRSASWASPSTRS